MNKFDESLLQYAKAAFIVAMVLTAISSFLVNKDVSAMQTLYGVAGFMLLVGMVFLTIPMTKVLIGKLQQMLQGWVSPAARDGDRTAQADLSLTFRDF
jgi:uncharacterized membrane protein